MKKKTRKNALTGKRHFWSHENSGSTMVLTIVAVAFVGILAFVILILSATNYHMKYTDLHAKDTFYSAETAMDQIRTGLKGEVSAALSDSYVEIFQKYGSLTEEERENNFKYLYINYLRKALRQDETDAKYDISILEGYLEPEILANTELISTVDCKLEALESGVVLRGLKLTYKSPDDYVSVISTDIRLAVPELNFTQSSSMPDLFEFSIVANQTLTGENTGIVEIKNSVYGGQSGISLSGVSNWKFSDGVRLITNEEVSIGSNSSLTVGENMMFWAGDLIVDSGSMNLNGTTYIKDDLTILGKSSSVILNNAYYGYGNTGVEENSSAILINGSNSHVDLSGLNHLLLSGNAFIGTSSSAYTSNSLFPADNNKDILMGESLAVKSNQIAYLVPSECIGVDGNGVTLIGKNPMSRAEYETLLAYAKASAAYPNFKIVDFEKTVRKLGVSLDTYVPDYLSTGGYQPIFHAANGDTQVYFYLVMDEEHSSQYFRDYYKADRARLDKYLEIYGNRIISNDSYSRIALNGNLLAYDGRNSSLTADNRPEGLEEQDSLSAESDSYVGVFEALTTKLITNISEISTEETGKSVFHNLILEEELKSFLASYGPGNRYVFQIDGDSNSLQGLLIHNEGAGSYEYSSTESDNLRLIVATGDVVVSDDFSGLIIAKGSVSVKEGSTGITIQGNKEDLTKVLQYSSTEAEGSKRVIDFFKDSSRYILDGTVISPGTTKDDYLDLSSLIVYENWLKQ